METNIHHLQHPIKIYTITLGINLNYKKECIETAYKIGDRQNQETNVKAIMSGFMVWEETDTYNFLLDEIVNKIRTIVGPSDYRHNLFLHNAWTAIYKQDHYTIPHHHEPSHYSFVYYLKTSQNSSPLIFPEIDFRVECADDLLIIFPSYVVHSVPPQKDNKDRICLAGNFDMLPLTSPLINPDYPFHSRFYKIT